MASYIIMHLQRSFGVAPKSPLQKYDALQDKFASFYFNGYGVKKHLKKLRKVIELEPHKKGYRQYTQMLNQKLEELEQEELAVKQRIKPYEQSLKPASLHKLKKMQNFFEEGRPKEHSATLHPDPGKRDRPLFNNLPKISKSNLNVARHSELAAEASSLEKQQGKQQGRQLRKEMKSMSTAEKLGRSMSKGKKLSVNRDRSEKAIQLNKSTLYKKPEITIEEQLEQVKHADFLAFLRKRQEQLMAPTNSKHRINEAIEEDLP